MTLASDNASNFRAALTRELLSRLGISPVFSTAYHTVSIVEKLHTNVEEYDRQNGL
jgi:transposase InsO family protein